MTTFIALSGGVDSSVAAALLKEQGAKLVGIFMHNWDEGECSAHQDWIDAQKIAHQIGIDCLQVNFAQEYRTHVFTHFLEQYAAGFTPNPDILCNQIVKFGFLWERVQKLGATALATGHYARLIGHTLHRGSDPNKDQSYFLAGTPQSALQHALFPLGGMTKNATRAHAARLGLATQSKKESMGICFIGSQRFAPFLQKYLPAKPGRMVTPEGVEVGRHNGIAFYTIGQRRGLGLGGEGEPWYVVDKIAATNTLVVVRGAQHPALLHQTLTVTTCNWHYPPIPDPFYASVQIRYRTPPAPAKCCWDGEQLQITFDTPQWGVAPGQYAVCYWEDRVVVGGTIAARA